MHKVRDKGAEEREEMAGGNTEVAGTVHVTGTGPPSNRKRAVKRRRLF